MLIRLSLHVKMLLPYYTQAVPFQLMKRLYPPVSRNWTRKRKKHFLMNWK